MGDVIAFPTQPRIIAADDYWGGSARGPFAVHVEREEAAWLVVCRQHGWLFGSRREAIAEAGEIARGFGGAADLGALR